MAKNIYEDLKIKDFCCEYALLDEIVEKAYNLRRGHTVDVVAKAELINFLFIELVQSEDFGVAFVEFDNTSLNNDEIYVLTIDDDLNIWIEECVRDGKPVTISSTYLYFYEDDVLQCVIDENIDEAIFPILFGFEQ